MASVFKVRFLLQNGKKQTKTNRANKYFNKIIWKDKSINDMSKKK